MKKNTMFIHAIMASALVLCSCFYSPPIFNNPYDPLAETSNSNPDSEDHVTISDDSAFSTTTNFSIGFSFYPFYSPPINRGLVISKNTSSGGYSIYLDSNQLTVDNLGSRIGKCRCKRVRRILELPDATLHCGFKPSMEYV